VPNLSILDKILALQPPPAEPTKPSRRWGPVIAAQRAALERSIGQAAARRQAKKKRTRIIDRIAAIMEPGGWYSRGDLVRAISGGRSDRNRLEDTMHKRGLVKRGLNSAWPGKRTGVGRTYRIYEPRWLYQLTGLGISYREFCLLTA
jgi:hypothetical protein